MAIKPQPAPAGPEKAAKRRILIADDHPLVREGLVEIINCQADLICCGQAASGTEVEAAVAAQRPDLLVPDLRLGTADGIEVIRSSRARFGGLRILALSQLDETVHAESALRAGALGYVMKEQATDELVAAMRAVLAGRLYVSHQLGMAALERIFEGQAPMRQAERVSLTGREMCVFQAIGAGKSLGDIGTQGHRARDVGASGEGRGGGVLDCGGKAKRRHRFPCGRGFRKRRGASLPAAVHNLRLT